MSQQLPPPGPYGPPAGQPDWGSASPVGRRRPWYKKKRFNVPLGLFALLVLIGILVPAPEESDQQTAAPPAPSPSVSVPAAQTPAASSVPPAAATPSSAPVVVPPPVTQPPAPVVVPPPAPAETEASSTTRSQENAAEKAEQYLQFSAFSRSGLIKQLEFEGFSEADATYGVDEQDADWKEQAAKKAESYLDLSSFSKASLQQQLEFEGFTGAEAAYGVAQTGL